MFTDNNIDIDLVSGTPPTVKCWILDHIHLVALCPHCGLYHVHGRGNQPFSDPAGAGHRVADCDNGGRGYILAPDPKPATQRVLRGLSRRRPAKPPMRRASDEHLRAWIADTCRQGPECVAVPSDLFASWKAWAKANGFGVGDFLRFKLRVEQLGFRRECGRPWFRGLELIEPGQALLGYQFRQTNRRDKAAREAAWFKLMSAGRPKLEASDRS